MSERVGEILRWVEEGSDDDYPTREHRLPFVLHVIDWYDGSTRNQTMRLRVDNWDRVRVQYPFTWRAMLKHSSEEEARIYERNDWDPSSEIREQHRKSEGAWRALVEHYSTNPDPSVCFVWPHGMEPPKENIDYSTSVQFDPIELYDLLCGTKHFIVEKDLGYKKLVRIQNALESYLEKETAPTPEQVIHQKKGFSIRRLLGLKTLSGTI